MADLITSELDFAVQSLENRGFEVAYRPTTWKDDSFYRIVSNVKRQNVDHPKFARREIQKIQKENEYKLFFMAFKPEFDLDSTEKVDPEVVLKSDLDRSKSIRDCPTRRDMHAAAEFLQRSIHLIFWHPSGAQKEIIDPPFTSYETDEILYVLLVSRQNKTAYVQLTPTEGFTDVEIADHSQCLGMTFRRSLGHQLHSAEETNAEPNSESWKVDQRTRKDFFCSLSKTIYGSEVYHKYVRELIVKCLREDVLAEVFFDGTNNEEDTKNAKPKEKERVKKEKRRAYIAELKGGKPIAGKAELYAASSLYRTQIFVQGNTKSWDVFFPLTLQRKASKRSSYITLNAAHGLLVPSNKICNCLLEQPPVEYLESINSEKLHAMVFRSVVSQRSSICCPGRSRHDSHTHLDRFCNKRRTEYTRHCSSFPVGIHIDGRTLDKVTEDRGTFRQCIHKLIYSTDDVSDDFEVREEAPDDEYLLHIARWLDKLIYVYSSRTNTWRVYRHDPPQRNGSTKQCRYYITLFHDYTDDRYDIIIPDKGCNCIRRPPAVNTNLTGSTRFISKDNRHNPLTEFFLDDGICDSFSDETQNILSRKGDSQIYEVFHRPDMQFREVDKGHTAHSLYTCLSKEIFGDEEQALKIEELVATEMLDNADQYVSLLGVKSDLRRGTLSLQNEVDKTLVPFLLLFGHLPLFAAATVFQTPIYVLKVEELEDEENKWKSSWSSFTQVRRKRSPDVMPQIQSKCRRNGNFDRYYVTLLQDPYGNFLRVIPKQKECNCQLDIPDVPVEFVPNPDQQEALRSRDIASQQPFGWEVAEDEIIHTFRRLDNALGQNLQNIRQLMGLISTQLLMYDLIVAVFESRRRNINITSITGSSVSVVGAGLLILGFALAPVSAGATVSLSVIGGIISGLGSASVIGAKITEGALTKHQLGALIVIHELLDVLSKEAVKSNTIFKEIAEKVMTSIEGDVGELDDLDEHTSDIAVVMAPALGRLMGSFHIVPVMIARITLRVSSIIAGSVMGGLSLAIDAVIIAHAVYNLNKGNKTETSEMLRKNADLLRAIKVKLESYVHGNVG
ncbi:uncharacterized protein LOC110448245 [Mizuhopecten yessoensis]|uniref:uncharacterized protein LOC110448245 n=1 Tax=Mizuhopecten yessoensis TaxID=6573 RepID=UPI000B45C57C|nr:uncharacterized protein LOC110448245 [Mizuhopecten yessoensis]